LTRPVTLVDIAAFFAMSVEQICDWSCAAFVPEDAFALSPCCNCSWVQRQTFGYSGADITSHSARSTKLDEEANFACSGHIARHQLLRLLLFCCIRETGAGVPTLGLSLRAGPQAGAVDMKGVEALEYDRNACPRNPEVVSCTITSNYSRVQL
jgi:hypothetical protein